MQSTVKQKHSTNATTSTGIVPRSTPTCCCSVISAQLFTVCADAQITCTIHSYYVCYRLYVKSPDTTQKVIVSQNAHPLACFFLSRVSMQCMQSAILLWQIRPSVCPSNGGTVCKRSEWADRHTFLMTWQGHPSSFWAPAPLQNFKGTPSARDNANLNRGCNHRIGHPF